MPPERSKTGPKPFKPPRPSTAKATATSSKGPSQTTTSKKSKKATQKAAPASASTPSSRIFVSTATPNDTLEADEEEIEEDVEDPYAEPAEPSNARTATSGDTIVGRSRAENTDTDVERAGIPGDLVTRLLHEFMSEGMRISKGADKATGMYVETFVREAIARAAFEREEVGGGDGFLEVEDLEKSAPQLVLDF